MKDLNNTARYDSEFQYGQETAKKVSRAAMLGCVISVILYFVSTAAQIIALVITLILVVWTIILLHRYCRCPNCGKQMYMGALQVKVCPRCHHNLYTGKKAKKKNR